MIRDYYRALKRRAVTQVADGAGGFTETTADTTFWGYIAEYGGREVLINRQLGSDATCELFTEAALSKLDRVVDGDVEYEVVWAYKNHHLRYPLRQVRP